MSDIVIQAENISKKYYLGTKGTGSIRQDMNRWWQKRILKKEAPYFDENGNMNTASNILWALKDVNLEVRQGEAFGIIGHNGAGKSTFLKILAKIIRPTEGSVKGRGKVSSLLEVGTGFHQDLTGRENIFVSGNMLGMNRKEILQKFDEVVDFSGIEPFLDTPVKRYSSGMYVRLAFAVAAHLEPDILIVDEVLAVGDAEFQKKCIGKMKDVSTTKGRTIIFVSHNLQAIANLCNNVVWLDHGTVKETGKALEVVHSYMGSSKEESIVRSWKTPQLAPGNEHIKLRMIQVIPQSDAADEFITVRTPVEINVEFWCFKDDGFINVNVALYTVTGECVFNLGSQSVEAHESILVLKTIIPGNLLNNNHYSISLTVMKNHSFPLCEFPFCVSFDVEDVRNGMNYFGKWPGIIRPTIENILTMKQPI